MLTLNLPASGEREVVMNDYFEIYKDARWEYRWRLRAGNHLKIADSGEGYSTARGARQAVDRFALARQLPPTKVIDLTGEL